MLNRFESTSLFFFVEDPMISHPALFVVNSAGNLTLISISIGSIQRRSCEFSEPGAALVHNLRA